MKTSIPKVLKDVMMLRSTLQQYHPLIIEGHTRDARDASVVAKHIVGNLRRQWERRNVTKPVVLVTQGDPITERGISAVTRHVADELGVKRCLVCLDDHIDPEHSADADRRDVAYETRYSLLTSLLEERDVDRLTRAVEQRILAMNEKRQAMGKDPLADWYQKYAMLQEVTKYGMKIAAGGSLTLAHTTDDVHEFSVTSFYSVGVDLGFVTNDEIVPYSECRAQL